MAKYKVNWSINSGDPVAYTTHKVNAGNFELVIKNLEDEGVTWNPSLNEQLENLLKEWADPDSDGHGILTSLSLAEVLTNQAAKDITEEIDKQILGYIK